MEESLLFACQIFEGIELIGYEADDAAVAEAVVAAETAHLGY